MISFAKPQEGAGNLDTLLQHFQATASEQRYTSSNMTALTRCTDPDTQISGSPRR